MKNQQKSRNSFKSRENICAFLPNVVPMEPEQKKMKKDETPVENCEIRCKHFVKRKKRYCKMTVGKGKEYCGEHEVSLNGNDAKDEKNRIPCPLDPKHTVYANKLEKHLKICNAKPKNLPDYIVPGINSFSDNEGTEKGQDSPPNSLKLSEIDEKTMKEIIGKVDELHSKYIKIEESILQHNLLVEEMKNPTYGPSTLKHLLQSSSILGNLKNLGFLQDDTAFIEFGAGKGQISFYLATAIQQGLKNSKVLLIDRASHRHKKDNKIEDKEVIQRVRADISDLDLRRLDMVNENKKFIGVSKHLCGAATDLALRCIVKGNVGEKKTEGFLIALCCHHRCDWKPFVGKKFLLENGINRESFEVITKMVGWAICGTGMSREKRKVAAEVEDKPNNTGYSRDEREIIGKKCKRILDYARITYMEANSFSCSLKLYAKSDVTLENVCLIGKLNVKKLL